MIRGEQGGSWIRDELQCIFYVCNANLSLNLYLKKISIGFGITSEKFEKDIFYSGIILNFPRSIWKI